MKRRAAYTMILFLLLASGVVAQAPSGFVVTKEPALNGVRVTADLPAGQHHRNVGGSDGAGLCVYTSAWHAAIWQSVADMYAFRDWMRQRPGGSYPDKFDATLAAYCKQKGIPLPQYVQHTGGDVEFLKLGLKTGRMMCITYCGVDGPEGYGSEVIAHMVNLVHLDDSIACILDNNFPGRFLWMPAADLIARWRGVQKDGRPFQVRVGPARWMPVGGGWAIALLASPPPPYPTMPASVVCPCGDDCKCAKGDCPAKCPAAPRVIVGQCANGQCQIPSTSASQTSTPLGTPPSDRHEWGYFPELGLYGWRLKTEAPVLAQRPERPPQIVADPFPGGVVSDKLFAPPSWSISGRPCTKDEAISALSLIDDSSRWSLAAVGDKSFCLRVREDVAKLPGDVKNKVHVQCYTPEEWQVSQFRLLPGVTLRKPAVGRIGADAGAVTQSGYSPAALDALLAPILGVVPQPMPGPAPVPTPAPGPDVQPKPSPVPAPAPDRSGLIALLIAALALLAAIFRR